jgi:hypothetical protein
MDNTTYEFFIRRCWKCERFEHGADTDIWEGLLIKHYNFKNDKYNNATLEKLYQKKLIEVKTNLDKAFIKLLKKVKDEKLIIEIDSKREAVAKSLEPSKIFEILTSMFPILNDNKL